MTVTKSNIRALRDLVSDQIYGSTNKNYLLVEIDADSTTSADTYDISGDIDSVSGIVGPVCETWDEAVAATASTWSSTTVTFAGQTGSGRYRGVWLVEVQ